MNDLLRCTDCPRLAGFLADVRSRNPDYHGRPVLPFGDPKARLHGLFQLTRGLNAIVPKVKG